MLEFNTGALREDQTGKGRFDYLDMKVISEWQDFYKLKELYSKKNNVLWNLATYLIERNENKLHDNFIKNHLMKAMATFILEYYDGSFEVAMLELAVHGENGAKKYGPHNWKKGVADVSWYNSALRHYFKTLAGFDDENHRVAFLFNLMGLHYNLNNNLGREDY